MFKVHLNNTKHITIANVYIPPRDNTSTHYKTADKNIEHCIQHITTIPPSVLTGDVNAHSSLWHSYTDAKHVRRKLERTWRRNQIITKLTGNNAVLWVSNYSEQNPNIIQLKSRTSRATRRLCQA